MGVNVLEDAASTTKAEAERMQKTTKKKLRRKKYEKELARLHVELVKLQEWVKHKCLKVCVVFEGRGSVERIMASCTEEQAEKSLRSAPMVEKAMGDSGITLTKNWLEVSPEEQTHRVKARIEDGRRIWKLSPMDPWSYSLWYDYSKARDEMFAAKHTHFAPCYVARTGDKKRGRLNIITHLLELVPFEEMRREEVKLPKRQKARGYREPEYPYDFVDELF